MQTTETHTDPIAEAVANLGDGPLTEESLAAHIHPLFSRVQQGLRERDEIYLANHSLGRPLDRMADDVRAALDAWYETMDDAWQPWEDAMHRYRGVVANLIGCADPRAVVTKTSAGQGLRAVLNAMETTRPRIVTTTGEFDSIDFILKTYAHRGRADIAWVGPDDAGLFQAERIIEAISSDTDLVVVSQICYATGQVIEHLPSIIERAHAAHALVVIDTYHSAGAMPVGFGDLGADFAIGGNYKYTRGGPGACWLAINAQHLSASSSPGMRTLDTGWFAKAGTMEFERPDQPLLGSGGDAWLESTPPVLAFVQALAGLELTTALGPARLAAFNTELQQHLATELDRVGVRTHLIEPRGSYLLVPTDTPTKTASRLRAQARVICDARPAPVPHGATPTLGFVRFCPDILSTRAELTEAAERIGRAI